MSCPSGGQGINPSWWLTLPSSHMVGRGSLPQPGPPEHPLPPVVLPRRWWSCVPPGIQQPFWVGGCWMTRRFSGVATLRWNKKRWYVHTYGLAEVMANWSPDWYCFCSIKKAWKQHVFTAVSGPCVYPVHSGSTVLSDQRSRSPWDFCLFSLMEVTGRKYFLNLKSSNCGTRSLNHPTAEHLVNHRSTTWQ